MSTTDTTTWEWDDTYSRATLEQTTPHGVYRAVIERDAYPEAPDYDQAPPIYAYDSTGYGYRLEDSPRAGADSDRASGVDFPAALAHFYERARWSDALETLDRYLRAFHGGGVREVSSTVYQGAPWFLTYETRAMRESWGLTGELLERSDPQAYDWQAYADGEVYVVSVERATFDEATGEVESWETCDDGPVGGYYGEEYAQQAAREMLADEVAHTASTMLPMGA